MATVQILHWSDCIFIEDEIAEQDESISDDKIPQLLEEIRLKYDVNEPEDQPDKDPNVDYEPRTLLNDAIDNIDRSVPSDKSCASCYNEQPVVNAATFAKGQHISMPGQYKRTYDRARRKQRHAYKHHAIVAEVKSAAGLIAELVLIHFTSRDGKMNIYKTTETYDLRYDEIYLVKYDKPRYGPDEIVRRAESMLPEIKRDSKFEESYTVRRAESMPPENRRCGPQFDSYNVFTTNCEHFATWCVVGKGESFQVQGYRQIIVNGLNKIFGSASLITKGLLRILLNSADEIATSFNAASLAPEITLGATAGLYLLYCIIMTVLNVREYRKGHMCRSCLKGKLQDLWFTFGVFGITSVLTAVILQFALPLLGLGPFGIPFVILLVLLSIALQWSVPKIRKAIQSPFQVDRNKITDLSEINCGDIISFPYYGLEHVAVVTAINKDLHQVGCVHYSLPGLLKTRVVKEETFTLNPLKKTVKLFDCRHLECRPWRKVIALVRKRVGETKWYLHKRSDHLCYWAKVEPPPRGQCEDWADSKRPDQSMPSSAFIRDSDVHLMTDLQLGDVVKYYHKGILVGIKSLDNNYGRQFEIEMIEYSSSWYIRKQRYTIDLNKHALKVSMYHPAHCHTMTTRVARALALKDKKGQWWTTENFIIHCIMRRQT